MPPRRPQVRASDASAVGDVVSRVQKRILPCLRTGTSSHFRGSLASFATSGSRRWTATACDGSPPRLAGGKSIRRGHPMAAISPSREGRNGRSRVLMVSALGGPEQLIAEQGEDPTWLPDSRSLVMARRTSDGHRGLVHQVLETGARRLLTEAPDGFVDAHPRVSPDGKTLAFERFGSGRSGLFVVPMSGGAPTQIGDWSSGFMGGLSWTPDGREILFPRPEMSGRRLLRVSASGREPAVAVPGIPLGSISPSVSHLRGAESYRLAIVSGQPDMGLRMIDHAGSTSGRHDHDRHAFLRLHPDGHARTLLAR